MGGDVGVEGGETSPAPQQQNGQCSLPRSSATPSSQSLREILGSPQPLLSEMSVRQRSPLFFVVFYFIIKRTLQPSVKRKKQKASRLHQAPHVDQTCDMTVLLCHMIKE